MLARAFLQRTSAAIRCSFILNQIFYLVGYGSDPLFPVFSFHSFLFDMVIINVIVSYLLFGYFLIKTACFCQPVSVSFV